MFDDITPESLKKSILERMETTLEKREGSFLDHLVGPVALEIWKAYQSMNALVPIAYVDETSGLYIDKRCAEYGITRKEGTKARAEITLTGTSGTMVPRGTAFLSEDGLEFDLLEEVRLADGTGSGTVEAKEAGSAYNVHESELTQMVVTLSGLSGWSNGEASGGSNAETDGALVERLYSFLQRPATSGNVYHYERWAMEVNGVGAARVTPLWNGPGTVKVLLAGPEMEPVAESVAAAAAEHIEEVRPIGANVTVQSAEGLTIHVACSVVTDGSVTKQQVRSTLEDKLKAYLKELAFAQETVLYNRVAFLLMNVPGVTDFTQLLLNGTTGNVPIGAEQVPVVGEVTVT